MTGDWRNANFATPERGIWPEELLERKQWMGHVEKKPYAPWGDRNAPAPCTRDDHDADTTAKCRCDARWKWGYTEHYVDGPTIALAEDDPQLDGRAFLQQPDDPYAYVDGDDVRDPKTGRVHPAFIAILEHLGPTYADISQSGTGVHAIYRGELPDGVKQASWQLGTEPWGANTDLPSIEIYPGKRVCVMTGEHVPGTPTEIRAWNPDTIPALLEANDQVAAQQRNPRPSTTRADYDLDTYEPKATSRTETTGDLRDVFAALDRLDARAVAERTIVHAWNPDASTSAGKRAFYPTWGPDSNGTANIVDSEIWQDTGDHGGYGGPVVMALIHAGEIYPENASPRTATGERWVAGVDHLRELGFDIPQLGPYYEADAEHVALLPRPRRFEETVAGWDWRHAAQQPTHELTIEDARQRTTDAIADAYTGRKRVLIEALPTMGKSYGAIAAAATTDTPITVLTGRGRKEQYAQFREWCREHDLQAYTLPAFTRDCTTANGTHGEAMAEQVRDWYARGATPQAIHQYAEYTLGHPLPCQQHGGRCPYAAKWEFDPSDFDVLIGHYSHAYKPKVTAGRMVVFDEFPDAFETTLAGDLPRAASTWLQQTPGVPFRDYTDLVENHGDERRRADALTWFQENDLAVDGTHVLRNPGGHAAAPLAVYTILAGSDLGNGFERTTVPEVGTGVRDRTTGGITLLRPPGLEYARGVVALDGTPTIEMWRLALRTHLAHAPVLAPDERATYIEEALNLQLVRTTDAVKPYNCPDHVNSDQDAALLEAICADYEEQPSIITTATAEREYDRADVTEYIAESRHYGNVLGSNEYARTRLGAVIGSNHYGDAYLKKWGAFAGEAVERGEGKGADLTYGEFGDKVLAHMREHDTLQAAMRFGRDGNGAVVYVHTNTLPEWVPTAGQGRVITTWSPGMRQVLAAAETLEEWTTAELAAHPEVHIGERQVRNHLTTLAEDYGVLTRHTVGCGFVWRDDGLHEVGEHGAADLVPVPPETLTDDESAELARNTLHTWEFRTSRELDGRVARSSAEVAPDGGRESMGGGGWPPDPPDQGWNRLQSDSTDRPESGDSGAESKPRDHEGRP